MIGTTALLVGLAGAGIGKAAMNAHQSGKASRAQQEGAKKAADASMMAYRDQKAYQAPYVQAGGQSMNLLGALMTPNNAPGAYRPGTDYRIPEMGVGQPGTARRRSINSAISRSPEMRSILADYMMINQPRTRRSSQNSPYGWE